MQGWRLWLPVWSAPITKPNDRQSVHLRAPLSVALGPIGVLRNAGARPPRDEVFSRQRLEVARTLGDVALVKDFATGDEQPIDLFEKVSGNDAAFHVPLLPPWIGKMQKHRAHGSTREARQHGASVFGKDASARGKASCAQPVVDDRSPLSTNLEAEEKHVGMSLEAFDEEAPASWTDFELDGSRPGPQDIAGIDLARLGEARSSVVTGNVGHVRGLST